MNALQSATVGARASSGTPSSQRPAILAFRCRRLRFGRIVDAENRPKTPGRGLGHEIAERRDVLMQLAISREGAVAAEIERHRRTGDLLRLVGIAEQEFAGRERPPLASAIKGAVAGYP